MKPLRKKLTSVANVEIVGLFPRYLAMGPWENNTALVVANTIFGKLISELGTR